MFNERNFKNIIKGYSKTILSSKSQLTKDIKDKIDKGDEDVIRNIFEQRKNEIIQEANEELDADKKQDIISQADSVQEVINNLSEILNA